MAASPRKRRRRRQAPEHRALLNANRHRYDAILARQGGTCALCHRPPSPKRKLDMDHDHETMKIRGLLCVRCNKHLLKWMTSAWCDAAAEYLRNPPAECV